MLDVMTTLTFPGAQTAVNSAEYPPETVAVDAAMTARTLYLSLCAE